MFRVASHKGSLHSGTTSPSVALPSAFRRLLLNLHLPALAICAASQAHPTVPARYIRVPHHTSNPDWPCRSFCGSIAVGQLSIIGIIYPFTFTAKSLNGFRLRV